MTKLGYENLKKDDESVVSVLTTKEEKSYSTLQLILVIIGSMVIGIVIYDILFVGNIWCGILKLLSSKEAKGYQCSEFGNVATGVFTS